MLVEDSFLQKPLSLRAERIGGDLLVLCAGGTMPHLGGCAMAVPYRRETGALSASVSSLSAPGHQDAVLAAQLARRLCKRFSCTVMVQCGIHFEQLSPAQLGQLQDLVLNLGDRLEADLL